MVSAAEFSASAPVAEVTAAGSGAAAVEAETQTPGVEGRVPAAGSEGISDGFGAVPAAGSQSTSARSPVTEVTGAGVAPAVEARPVDFGAGPAETLRERLTEARLATKSVTMSDGWPSIVVQSNEDAATDAAAVIAAWLRELYGANSAGLSLDPSYAALMRSARRDVLHDLIQLVDSAIGSAAPDSPAVARVSSVTGPSSPAAGDP